MFAARALIALLLVHSAAAAPGAYSRDDAVRLARMHPDGDACAAAIVEYYRYTDALLIPMDTQRTANGVPAALAAFETLLDACVRSDADLLAALVCDARSAGLHAALGPVARDRAAAVLVATERLERARRHCPALASAPVVRALLQTGEFTLTALSYAHVHAVLDVAAARGCMARVFRLLAGIAVTPRLSPVEAAALVLASVYADDGYALVFLHMLDVDRRAVKIICSRMKYPLNRTARSVMFTLKTAARTSGAAGIVRLLDEYRAFIVDRGLYH